MNEPKRVEKLRDIDRLAAEKNQQVVKEGEIVTPIEIENEIAGLVQKLKNDTPVNGLPARIGDHTKAILGHCTGVTEDSIRTLKQSLEQMENHLSQSKAALYKSIDQHIHISQGAHQATQVINSTLKEWAKELAVKS